MVLVVNLFEWQIDCVLIKKGQYEFLIIIDRICFFDYEVYVVMEVNVYFVGGEKQVVDFFYSVVLDVEKVGYEWFYIIWCLL